MKVVEYRIAKVFIIVMDGCILTIHEVITTYFNETVFNSDHLTLRDCYEFLPLKRKEPSLLGTSYKTKDVFIRSSYYYYCEKPA